MTQKSIDSFDKFYCMSDHDANMSFTVREIFKQHGDKTCVGRKSLHKFGSSTTVENVESSINTWGEFEVYQESNIALNMSSSSNSDTGTVFIEYMSFNLNGDFVFSTQSKALSGRTPVVLNDSGCRWMRMYTTGEAVGDIYLYRDGAVNGVPSDLTKVHNMILAGTSQSQKASTSVSGNNYLLLTRLWADVIRKSSVSASLNMKTRKLGESFRTRPTRGLSDNQSLEYNIMPYLIIEPNTDIEITAITDSASNTEMTVGFNGYFADIISS